MVGNEPEKEEIKPSEEQPSEQIPLITPEQLERAKKVSRSVFNDAVALLFDADNRLSPLCKTKDLAFTFIVAALYIFLSTIFWKRTFPLVYFLFPTKTGLAFFLGGIVYYFAGALSVFVCVRYLAGKSASYTEGLNIMSISFIPLIIAVILGFIFSFAASEIAFFIEWFGGILSLLLIYNALRVHYELSIRSSIYLLPIILTVLYIILRVFFKIFF